MLQTAGTTVVLMERIAKTCRLISVEAAEGVIKWNAGGREKS